MNKVTMTGRAAELRWSYHRAAALTDWTLTTEATKATLTATVGVVDAFKVSQQPLTFVVPRPKSRPWVWPIVSLHIAGTQIHADLGPQEGSYVTPGPSGNTTAANQ